MHEILDLDRFPLDRPDSDEWRKLVEDAQHRLSEDGMFNLDSLVRQKALRQIVAPLDAQFATEGFNHVRRHNIYFDPNITSLPDDHPALKEVESVNHTLCADQLQPAIIDIYSWLPLVRFLEAVMEVPVLYTMDDPLARVNVMSYREGEGLNWHFDRSTFTTTLLLQAPADGGVFCYRTNLRSEDDPNYDGVARLLKGEDDRVQLLSLAPGTLNVFKGKNTAHRVTPVIGKTTRIVAVFSYYERPGVMFSDKERIGFYGRAG